MVPEDISNGVQSIFFSLCSALRTQQVVDQLWVGCQRFRVCEDRVSAVLNVPESVKVPQQDVAEPLGVNAGDLPLLGLLILEPHGPGEKKTTLSTATVHLPTPHSLIDFFFFTTC